MKSIKIIFSFLTFLILTLSLFYLFHVLQTSENPKAYAASGIPAFDHIFVIMMENHAYNEVIGNPQAPFTNSLATKYSVAANYHFVGSPSLPNYLAATGGDTFGVNSDCTTCFQNADNIALQLEKAGKTWKAYMESMVSNCQTTDSYPYMQKHNPFAYYTNLTSCQQNNVPYTQFAKDLANPASLANFIWITPNMINDTHDASVATGDIWLSKEVPQILASSAFKNNGLLIIVYDEGGSNILALIASPLTKKGYVSTLNYDHYSLLKTIEDAFNLPALGNASNATSMSDFFDATAASQQPTQSAAKPLSPSSQGQYNCVIDPQCQTAKTNLQLCTLICKPLPTTVPTTAAAPGQPADSGCPALKPFLNTLKNKCEAYPH